MKMLLHFLELVTDPCSDPSTLKIVYFVKELINIFLIVVPIGLMIMLTFDLFKNVINGDEGIQKKNLNIFIRRIIMLVIVFLIPSLTTFFINFINENVNDNISVLTCISVDRDMIDKQLSAYKDNCIKEKGTWDLKSETCSVSVYIPKVNISSKKYIRNATKSSKTSNTTNISNISKDFVKKGKKTYYYKDGKKVTGKVEVKNGKQTDIYWFNKKSGALEGHILGITYIHQMYGVWNAKKKKYSTKYYKPNTKVYDNNTLCDKVNKCRRIGNGACGITSCSMAITSLRGKLTVPTEFNAYKYGFNGVGNDYNVAVKTAKKFKLKGKVYRLLTSKEIKKHIDKGHFIVIGVRGSIYGGGGDTKGGNSRTTGGGHFVLIHGYKGDKFAIADPNNESQSYVMSGKLNTYESFADHQQNHVGGVNFCQYGVIYK